eukprot:m.75590 g.75590  ORF g.75590 m.75590 type:complete len:456 (+) comp12453_c0_seq2:88-1455(+)
MEDDLYDADAAHFGLLGYLHPYLRHSFSYNRACIQPMAHRLAELGVPTYTQDTVPPAFKVPPNLCADTDDCLSTTYQCPMCDPRHAAKLMSVEDLNAHVMIYHTAQHRATALDDEAQPLSPVTKPKPQQLPAGKTHDPMLERIAMVHTPTGRQLTGQAAPSRQNVKMWLATRPDWSPRDFTRVELFNSLATARSRDLAPLEAPQLPTSTSPYAVDQGAIQLKSLPIHNESQSTSPKQSQDEREQCPLPSCDGRGHISGKYPTHNTLRSCPRRAEVAAHVDAMQHTDPTAVLKGSSVEAASSTTRFLPHTNVMVKVGKGVFRHAVVLQSSATHVKVYIKRQQVVAVVSPSEVRFVREKEAPRRSFAPVDGSAKPFLCPEQGCHMRYKGPSGLFYHLKACHPSSPQAKGMPQNSAGVDDVTMTYSQPFSTKKPKRTSELSSSGHEGGATNNDTDASV